MKKYFAECIGTFALVFCGTGAIVIDQESGGTITHLGIAITFGLIVTAMIYTFGEISGAHLNPVVTLTFSIVKLFPTRQIFPYILSQLTGAILASLLLKYLFPMNELLGGTIPAGASSQSFILELLLTFILMLVILQISQGKKEYQQLAGLIIGLVVLLEALFAGPICGASMNPFRSLAPAFVSKNLEFIWIYITAPTLGAISAGFAWKNFHK
jgi:aquaporin NIP